MCVAFIQRMNVDEVERVLCIRKVDTERKGNYGDDALDLHFTHSSHYLNSFILHAFHSNAERKFPLTIYNCRFRSDVCSLDVISLA